MSELASNAVVYTASGSHQGWFSVELAFGRYARIAVADLGGAGWLIGADRTKACTCDPDHDDPDDVEVAGMEMIRLGGRGLVIVTKLAVSTGACGSNEEGHLVWADLDIERPSNLNPQLLAS